MANPRRPYFLFNHTIRRRRRPSDANTTVITVPVISRALESTGEALGLTLATPEQLRTVRNNATYLRRGSSTADRVLVVYKETRNNVTKKRVLHLPIPRFAPNYKIRPIIEAANSGNGVLAGNIIGFYRLGFLFPIGQSSS